jgi:HD-like signal output (HDOD) protein
MVLSSSVVSVFRGIPKELLDMDAFWLSSVTCGVIARLIGHECKLLQGERLFLAGLLHQVGILVFVSKYPERYKSIIQYGWQDMNLTCHLEKQIFGFNHSELGAELLKQWQLADNLQVMVGNYLSPQAAPAFQKETCIIHLASRITHQVATGKAAAEIFTKHDYAWQTLGLDISTMDRIMLDTAAQVSEIMQTLAAK